MLSSSLRRLSSRTTRYVRVFCVPMSSVFFFFSSRRRHTRFDCDWSSDVCSSDLAALSVGVAFVKLGLAGVTSEARADRLARSEEHTSELQSQSNLVCRLLLEKKKKQGNSHHDVHRESDTVQKIRGGSHDTCLYRA